MTLTQARDPSPHQTFKFPPFQPDLMPMPEEEYGHSSSRTGSPSRPETDRSSSNTLPSDRWQPRRDSRFTYANGAPPLSTRGHGRQKSLGEAIRTIRTRKASVTQNAHEIAEALKAPLSPRLVMLCGVWYMTSIFTNMSSKTILTALPQPVTLTTVQFAFVSGWCLVLAALASRFPRLKHTMPFLKHGIRKPSRSLVLATLPLTCFQIGGHILSADATSRIPVSLVHTIKGLSPLLTVGAYSIFLNTRYSLPTYLSLIPLTIGVILACSADFNANFIGLLSAFASAILFVVQNIVSKQIFNDAAAAERDGLHPSRFTKPDKLNLLCYSSGMAFLFTLPLWLWSEGFTLIADFLRDASITLSNHPGSFDHGRLLLEFLFNGTFHFGQNIVAFVLLSIVSPVTYSVASLIKRVFVIVFAVVWFGKPITPVQAFGLLLTFVGLYLYDRTSDAAKVDRRRAAKAQGTLLPLSTESKGRVVFTASPVGMSAGMKDGGQNYLPPGTKAEDTWRPHEMNGRTGIGVL